MIISEIEINGKKYDCNKEEIKLYKLVKIRKYDNAEKPVVWNIKRKYILQNVNPNNFSELPDELFIDGKKCFRTFLQNVNTEDFMPTYIEF